jgi:hypothetical protein
MATQTIGKYAAILTANSDGFTSGMQKAARAASAFQKDIANVDTALGRSVYIEGSKQGAVRASFLRRAEIAQRQSMQRTLSEMAAFESKSTALVVEGEQQRGRVRAGGGGAASAGGLGGLAGMFGRTSQFSMVSKTLMGGGALIGLGLAADRLRQLGEALETAATAYSKGDLSAAGFANQLAFSIPIMGDIIKFGHDLASTIDKLASEQDRYAGLAEKKAATAAVQEVYRGIGETTAERNDPGGEIAKRNAIAETARTQAAAVDAAIAAARKAGRSEDALNEMRREGARLIAADQVAAYEQLDKAIEKAYQDERAGFEAEDTARVNSFLEAQQAALDDILLSKRELLIIKQQEAGLDADERALSTAMFDQQEIAEAGVRLQAENAKAAEKIAKADEAKVKKEEDRIKSLADKMKSEAKSLTESLRSPMQVYEAEITRFNEMLAAGAITWDEYGQAVRRARGELETKARTEVRGPGLIAAGTQEAARVVATRGEQSRREKEAAKFAAEAEKRAKEQVAILKATSDDIKKIAERLTVVEPI